MAGRRGRKKHVHERRLFRGEKQSRVPLRTGRKGKRFAFSNSEMKRVRRTTDGGESKSSLRFNCVNHPIRRVTDSFCVPVIFRFLFRINFAPERQSICCFSELLERHRTFAITLPRVCFPFVKLKGSLIRPWGKKFGNDSYDPRRRAKEGAGIGT